MKANHQICTLKNLFYYMMDGWTGGKQCQSKEDQLEAIVVAEARDHYGLDYMNIPVVAERSKGNWERFKRYNRKELWVWRAK